MLCILIYLLVRVFPHHAHPATECSSCLLYHVYVSFTTVQAVYHPAFLVVLDFVLGCTSYDLRVLKMLVKCSCSMLFEYWC